MQVNDSRHFIALEWALFSLNYLLIFALKGEKLQIEGENSVDLCCEFQRPWLEKPHSVENLLKSDLKYFPQSSVRVVTAQWISAFPEPCGQTWSNRTITSTV